MKNKTISRRNFLKMAGMGAAGASLTAWNSIAVRAANWIPSKLAAQTGTLTVWGWAGTLDGLQSQVKAFNAMYPEITVEFKTLGYDDVRTNLLNAIVAGTGAPDICAIDAPYLSQMVDGLVDLTTTAEPFKDLFVPPTFSAGSLAGKFYGIATDSEPMGVIYRKDIWDKYGIQESSINTWDDLVEAGNKLNTDSKGEVKLYHMNSDNDELFSVLAVQQGFPGYYFTPDDTKTVVDDPKMVEAATTMKRMWDGQGVQQNPIGGAYADECSALLKNGKLASQIVAAAWYPGLLNGNMPDLAGKWRLMPMPAIQKDGLRVGYAMPTLVGMTNQSQLQEAAWDLMKLGLIGDGARALYEKGRVLPAYQPLLDQIKDDKDPYFGGQQINQVWDQIAKSTPPVTYGVGLGEAKGIVGTHLNDFLTGQKTAEEALQEAAAEIRTKLDKA